MRRYFALCLPIFLVTALSLAGCGADGTSGGEVVSYLGNDCAIEMQFERTATQREVRAFAHQVRSTPHVATIELMSREMNIALFKAELRRSGYAGLESRQLEARFHRDAGRVLIATPDDNGNVPAIIDALQMLPAAVSSVADRTSSET
jgi:hypothetical protein